MEEILIKHNYKNVESNTWIKYDWTVRFDNNLIEIFNDPDKTPGRYYTAPLVKVDLEEILSEIDDYLIRN